MALVRMEHLPLATTNATIMEKGTQQIENQNTSHGIQNENPRHF